MDNSYFFAFFIVVVLLFLYCTTSGKKYSFPYLQNGNIENADGEGTLITNMEN